MLPACADRGTRRGLPPELGRTTQPDLGRRAQAPRAGRGQAGDMELGSQGRRWRPERHIWTTIGTALAILLGVGGLAAVGVIVFAYIALSQFGSNK
jgi:hypothetical protein